MINTSVAYVLALEHVAERAEILLAAPTDLAKLVAEGKLKDALGAAFRIKRDECGTSGADAQNSPPIPLPNEECTCDHGHDPNPGCPIHG